MTGTPTSPEPTDTSQKHPRSRMWVVTAAVVACACGAGTEGGAVDRRGYAPVYPSADELLEALEVGGSGCAPGSAEVGTEALGEQEGRCRAAGGTLHWSVDVGAAASPPPVEPGELGSGEERPSIHEEVCEHSNGALILGPNWYVLGDTAADLGRVAGILHGYLFVADCDGGTASLCTRPDFTGTGCSSACRIRA